MKKLVLGLLGAVSMVAIGTALSLPAGGSGAAQEVQKPKYDYMSTFLSRSTRPLGLKENPATRKMLNQGAVKWSIRAGTRQILD